MVKNLYLPAEMNNEPNPVIGQVLRKQVFHGIADLMDGWQYTVCKRHYERGGPRYRHVGSRKPLLRLPNRCARPSSI